MPEVIYKVDLPAFTGRNVPIKEIAAAIGKDAQYVRVGLQQGILKFGTAIKIADSSEYSYYCFLVYFIEEEQNRRLESI